MSARTVALPSLAANFRGSVRLLAKEPVACLAFALGIALSLPAVCCGLGIVMAPWLTCELLAVLLGAQLGEPIARSRAWLSAGVVLLGAVLLVAFVGWLTLLGLGTQPLSLSEIAEGTSTPWTEVRSGGALLSAAGALVSLVFVLPFMYAPLILLRTRATLGASVLESARLVARGALAHLGLSLVANAVQVLPLVLAAALATLLRGSDSGPLFMLASLPLLALSVPLGQGMVVSAYGSSEHTLSRLDRERAAGRPPWILVALWSAIVAAPILAFGLLGVSLARPSRIAEGVLPEQVEVLAAYPRIRERVRFSPEVTALEITFEPARAVVRASDGGGAGKLPLRNERPIESARIGRTRDRFGIELTQGGRSYTTFIDRAGVRLDDDLNARLFDRAPTWVLLSMLLGLVLTAFSLLPVMSGLGELRARYAAAPGSRDPPHELLLLRARTLRRTTLAGLVLLPTGLASLYFGLSSLIG